MTKLRFFALLAAGASLSACVTADTATRNAPIEPAPRTASQNVTQPVRINRVIVDVPQTLVVSEANRYLPSGDIVWRGDPPGDRHAQVKAIFEDGLQRGAKSLRGGRSADLLVSVRRFHALTEKARYSVGGVHHIVFLMALADPATGDLIVPWREVRADIEAYGGQKAIQADAQGQTQKVRITDHLARVLVEELTTTQGHQNPELGLIQTLNEI